MPAARRRAWWRIGISAVIAANAMTMALAVNTSEVDPLTARRLHLAVLAAVLVVFGLLGWPLLQNAVRELRRKRLTLEALFLAGIGGAMGASLVATFLGVGDVYYEVAAILLVVYSLGQQISRTARDRAVTAVTDWLPGLATCQVVGPDGATREVPADSVQPGDLVRVLPGRTLAADGVIEVGEGFVREAEWTGEFFAVVRRPGDQVWAGSSSVDATLIIRATAPGGSRRIDGVVQAVERARAEPATLQRQADRFIQVFLPVVVVIALATLVGWSWAAGWKLGLFHAMAVLVVACPCALGLATPVALWAALGRLARRGLVVRHGPAVEALAQADTVVFDKTGTLTESRTRLVDLVTAPPTGWDRDGIRLVLAAVERHSQHPVARAFEDVVPAGPVPVVDAVRVLPGRGVEGRVARGHGRPGGLIRIGLPRGVLTTPEQEATWRILAGRLRGRELGREVCAVLDGAVVAAAVVAERLRPGWSETAGALASMAVTPVLMTGDVAERAAIPGMGEVHAGLSPEEKLSLVREFQAGGRRVVFVGDGINDAAAMAAAQVSVAVASGAELAVEVGECTWHGGDLRVLPWALALARETVTAIRGNLRFAAGYNLVGVSLAAAGLLHPVVAALLMTCSSLIVTWRAASLGLGDLDAPGTERAPLGETVPVEEGG